MLATMTIEGPGISAYGVLAGEQDPENKRIYNCTRHGGEAEISKRLRRSRPSSADMCLNVPRIFALLEQTTPGAGGEIRTH